MADFYLVPQGMVYVININTLDFAFLFIMIAGKNEELG